MANEDYKETALHYQELANIYQCVYEDLIKEMNIVSELQGVYVEIKSDCIKYNQKHKKPAIQAENRLQIIEKAIKQMDYLINEKQRMEQQLKWEGLRYYESRVIINQLQAKVKANEKLWEEMKKEND